MAQTKPASSTPRGLHPPIRRLVRASMIFVATIGIAIQFIPYGRDRTNPPVRSEPAWDSQQTRALFVRAWCLQEVQLNEQTQGGSSGVHTADSENGQ